VDDASTDRTPQIAEALAAADPHVRVVHHPVNRKLGGSIKSGFAAATGDVVLYTDADLPFEMRELVRALRVLQTYEVDLVSAYRLDRTGEGPRRAIYSFLYNGLIRAMFGTRVRDINFAFKLVSRRVLDHVTLRSEGSFIDAELTIRAQKAGFEILQIGVDYFPRTRGVSTLSSLGVIRTMLGEMWTLRRELRALPARTAPRP
jgi:glycosyltransferase involved in cell wall biosynthesis